MGPKNPILVIKAPKSGFGVEGSLEFRYQSPWNARKLGRFVDDAGGVAWRKLSASQRLQYPLFRKYT